MDEEPKDDPETVTYQILAGASVCNGDLLLDNLGYTYMKKHVSSLSTTWICCVRSRAFLCRAAVVQRGEVFTRGRHPHLHHVSLDNTVRKVNARAIIKETIKSNLLKKPERNDAASTHTTSNGLQAMSSTASTACNGCNKGLKARQIAIQCDHCEKWHTLLGDRGLEETRETSEGYRMFSFPCVQCLTAASGDEKPNAFIFIEPQPSNAVVKSEPGNQLQNTLHHNGLEPSVTYRMVTDPLLAQPQLEDSDGHRYTNNGIHGSATVWRCAARGSTKSPGSVDCPAAVTQRGELFITGQMRHKHGDEASTSGQEPDDGIHSGITCEVSQGKLSCEITDAEITPLQIKEEVEDRSGLTYHIVLGGTSLGNDVLIDSLGHTYRRKKPFATERLRPGAPRNKSTVWRCSVYNNHTKCISSVIQKNDLFYPGKRGHIHPPGKGATRAMQYSTQTDRRSKRHLSHMRQVERRKNWPLREHVEGVTYERVEGLSKKHRSLLVDSLGYSYTLRREGLAASTWRCSRRSSTHLCHATVSQTGDTFKPGPYAHVHQPRPLASVKAVARIKELLLNDFSQPLPQIVNKVLREFESEMKLNRSNLLRIASRHRSNILLAAQGDDGQDEEVVIMDTDGAFWEMSTRSEDLTVVELLVDATDETAIVETVTLE